MPSTVTTFGDRPFVGSFCDDAELIFKGTNPPSIPGGGGDKIFGNATPERTINVYAVVYNQIDGAYVITGYLDANGVATFSGFKLRPASTITICR